MKALQVWALTIAATGVLLSSAFASDAVRGKELFNDPQLSGARAGSSCTSCHPIGSGLEKAGGKKEFKVMGRTFTRLEDAVNMCIEGRMKGNALDPKSAVMADLISHIRSLTEKAPSLSPKKRTAATGC